MAADPRFVHLRLHSEFSVVDGIVRVDEVVAAAAADGQGALALTDAANLFGAVRFYQAARAAGVKPIIGADCWVTQDAERAAPWRLLLLATGHDGYLSLCALLTRAWLDNAHDGRGELRNEWLTADATAGLIALSGFAEGEVGARLLAGQADAAHAAAARLAAAFPGRFYLELQRAGRAHDEALVRATVRLALAQGLPVVATHPVQFVAAADFRAHEARVAIAAGHSLADLRRPRPFTAEQYFLPQAAMAARFADLPAALANSVEIAKRCNLVLELGKPRLPDFPTPPGVTLDEHCVDLARAGLEARLASRYPDPAARQQRRPAYDERLAYELRVIASMGFSGYFLIVADFIGWAKANGIPVGPGRGSGAGSLVAYALLITDLDPLHYELLFERFLNIERVSMPDFDIDFCQEQRDRVIDYVKRKYGADAVSQIATFGTLGAKAVVRDVGRVLDVPYLRCDALSKLIPHNPADPWTLERALREEPAFAAAVAADEEYQEIVALSRQLEGLTRNVGMHAGGVLIAPGKLTDFTPLYCQPGAGDAAVSHYDKDDIEAIGLVKFDFLGLTTLTILQHTVEFVRRLQPDWPWTLETLPLDDPAAYAIFRKAQTTAIFQFESRGMRDLLKRAAPDRLEDLIALNALYRPGPMALIDDFIERKHGRARVEYLDPRLEPILGPTYGVMTYQEHVMTIAQVIAGYSLGQADILRRAMGKKKPEEMAKQRAIFMAGATERGMPAPRAQVLFDQMEAFAGYGFNKSHAAAYALLAYQTAYFKAHFPAAFMAANLAAVMSDTDKVRELVDDCRALGLVLEPPDLNRGVWRFEPIDARTIRYGLGGIKGAGQGAVEAIVAERTARGPYRSLFDFCARVDRHVVNRRVAEALARAGAFDALQPDRARVFASVARALDLAERAAQHAGQGGLFETPGVPEAEADCYVEVPPWSAHVQLTHEKAALGYTLSGHLFAEREAEVRRFVPTRLADLRAARDSVRLAGIVVGARAQNTRRGRMGVVVLDDGSAALEMTLNMELFDQKRGLLREDALVIAVGRVRFDEMKQALSINLDDLFDLPEARARAQARLRIAVAGAPDPAQLRSLLAPYRIARAAAPAGAANGAHGAARGNANGAARGTANGTGSGNGVGRAAAPAAASGAAGAAAAPAGRGCQVVIEYANRDGCVDLLLPDPWRVRGDDALLEELAALPQVRAAHFQYG